jgi:hypothetical protein
MSIYNYSPLVASLVASPQRMLGSLLQSLINNPRGKTTGYSDDWYIHHQIFSWRSATFFPWFLTYRSTTAQLPPVPTVAA